MTKGRRLSLEEAAALVQPRDTLLFGFGPGQPIALLEAVGARQDLEDITIYTGLMVYPFAFLQNPKVRVLSGFFGPVERAARAMGGRVEFLARDFTALERMALRLRARVVLAHTTPPDADGWMSFGLHSGATSRPFLEAARDPERIALAEANPRMPRLAGLSELGDNRIHVSEVDGWVEHASDVVTLPPTGAAAEEVAIAGHVLVHVAEGSTLQFGIGGLPDEIATRLAAGPLGDFGLHTELIADGAMRLHQAGKVTNRKGVYDGVSVATFAFGSQELYRWLDGNPAVRILPVSATNDPAVIYRLRRFVSVNSALAIDLAGQAAADHVGGRQYSGVGGHETFVGAASEAPGGQSFLCLKSTAVVGGRRISTIVPHLGEGAMVTTARHHVQWVVTEHGAVDVSALGDRERARALAELAHPDFRGALREAVHPQETS